MILLNDEIKYLTQLYDQSDIYTPATNVWLSGDIFENSLKSDKDRGYDEKTFYNLFVKITGVNDTLQYQKDLFYWKNNLISKNKNVFILDNLPSPTASEVNEIAQQNYVSNIHLITTLSRKIKIPFPTLKNQIIKSFIECVFEESKKEDVTFNKLKNTAILLVCLFNRYCCQIFTKENEINMPTLIYFGVCQKPIEALFFQFLAFLPLDILLINPDINKKCILNDRRLFEKKYDNTLMITKFPTDIEKLNFGTVAYQAEKELETILYQDTGLYKLRQYKRSVVITLKTMYEELFILWAEENRFRPDFKTLDDKAVIPTICAKIYGVQDDNVSKYWDTIRKLVTEDTVLFTNTNFYGKNDIIFNSTSAINKGKIDISRITKLKTYQYSIYREEVQMYIFDKLQELIDSKIIKGTFETGVEHKIVNVVMNLDKQILRLIQNMDFTKVNPKVILINTTEIEYNLEESIIIAFLHFIGFDISVFIPTGYRIIEKYFNQPLFIEYQIGEYVYELNAPNNLLERKQSRNNIDENFIKKIFKR